MSTPAHAKIGIYASLRRWMQALPTLTLLCGLFASQAVWAQTGTGSITGTVINIDTQKALDKAEVELRGSSLSAFSNPDGSFRINGVPAGSYTVQVSYAGLEPVEKTVVVQPNSSVFTEFSLTSGVISLTEFKVAGAREGNAYAVQQQRTSASQRMVVSADAFGIVADSNPGEFLKSLPGMTMEYTGIEPRKVSVRGLEPSLVQVLLNGNQVANAASASLDRAFEFDHTSIDAVEAMDVSLAPRPDLPANTIGGTINIVTRSALMQKGRRLSFTVSLSGNDQDLSLDKTSGPNDERSYKILPGFSTVYSDTFLDGKLGVAFSASVTQFHGMGSTAYDTYTFPSAANGGRTPTAASEELYHQDNTWGYISRYRREQHQNFQRRIGSSLNLDYKVSDETTLFFKTLFTDYFYEFRNRFIQYNVSNPAPGWTPETVQAGSGSNVEQEMGFGDKLGRSLTFNLGAKHEWLDWKVNYDAWLSRASSHYEYDDYFGGLVIRTPATFVISKNPGTAVANVIQLSSDVYSLNNYAPQGNVNANYRIGSDEFRGGKGSVRRDLNLSIPVSIEAGGFYQQQERKAGNHRRDYAWSGVTNMAQFAEDYDPEIGWGERAPDAWISPYKVRSYANANPGLFVENPQTTYTNAFLNDRRGEETITAGYLMTNVKLGKFDILAGARLEYTEMEAEGGVREGGTGPLVRGHSERTYSPSPFKDIHVKYSATKQLQIRTSYAEAFGRPNLSDLVPTASLNTSSAIPRWTVSNINLKPQRSQNLDAVIEYYIKGTNYVSAGWFRKDIKDYINTNITELTAGIPELSIPDPTGVQEISTRVNLPKARIEGFELSGRYALPFIPKAAGEFELWGNYTQLYNIDARRASFVPRNPLVSADYLPNVPPWFWNAGIAYRSASGKLRVNLKSNFTADKYKNYSQTREQVTERLTTDGDISYSINKTYTLSFAMRNIFDADEGETLAERDVRTGNGGGRAMTVTLNGSF